jgi:hypothetical protein
VTLNGLHRGVAGAAHTGTDGRLRVDVEERSDEEPPRIATAELEREYRAVVEEILDLRDADSRIHDFVRAITGAGALADTSAYAPEITFSEKVTARGDRRRRTAGARRLQRAPRRVAGTRRTPGDVEPGRVQRAARVHPPAAR